ncbi:hypothetical protein ASPZODRAFT_134051 [Penicilliopsis zonata CBS 506.65]|uniref:DUF1750-domain-containing protein n=1 Tax=Penicilliopsis zonata CBS 506.65 TaxID=1073090 RepID=A0A1L9SE26_9EURO|nr:hypothetical protein ASPZODRAFT_134051 [Penicilliopsis zonata CBS 506.65]OJJ45402.1 hypothetical protein ASPZODRAFT_134051 [Penicilliopsis zonata CBS 506.65]
MDDPASRIPGQLLPHMHLVSRYRYPLMPMLPTETAVEYLLSAPKIVRELQSMHWTFMDGPQDGTVMLTWQPLNHLGTNFASDGYVWADVEQAFTFEARGYTVEMWLHRSGYHPPNESTAIHCRRRYRLLPPKVPNPGLPPPDPSLWIVHYSRAPQTDHIPANRIPILPQVQSMLAQRRFLQSQGQLARKEFMLHDRNNWPTINFPPQMAPQGFVPPAAAYAGAIPGRQPGPYYPQQVPGMHVPPAAVAVAAAVPTAAPSKVPRGHRPSVAAIGAAAADFALDDEDVSTGDLMDLLTPREVSKMRYQQHHEWMEEIFASPYAISQITPVSLGLGRKGELESLTAGFFDAPAAPSTGDSKEATDAAPATKLEPLKAEEFADRVAKKVADMTAEIEKLKKRHSRRMEKYHRTSLLKDAELRLREAAADPQETGTEIWRLEGRIEIPTEDGTPQVEEPQPLAKYKVDDIARQVESSWKKQIVFEPKISCVQKGGLLEKIEPEKGDAAIHAEGDLTMENTESQFLDQFGSSGAAGTGPAGAPAAHPAIPDLDVDMEMGGGDGPGNTAATGTASGETGDWVMVNNERKEGGGGGGSGGGEKPTELPAAIGTPGSGMQGYTPGPAGSAGDSGLDPGSFDFTNIDSAGDALAAYSEQNDELDLPDLENSAFGDAFHASDNEHSHHHDDDMS